MIEIDPDRLLADLRQLATFGKVGTGVDRTAFSDADVEARRWLRERMAEGGLEARIDGVGNVVGRTPGNGPAVLIGSHTDSVPKGGWLDGSMGVIYGLEIARASLNGGGGAIDVISFQDEEGTFKGLLGSGSLCGEVSEDDIAEAEDAEGRSLTEALQVSGLSGEAPERLDRDRYAAYLEAHIEQGPRLEAEGKRIGIVTGIVGIRRLRITFTGQADHAGTTPMSMRKDSAAAAFRFADAVRGMFQENGGADTVWNIGAIRAEPGASNVVAAATTFMLEFRDLSPDLLDDLQRNAVRLVTETQSEFDVGAEIVPTSTVAPSHMDDGLAAHIEAAVAALEEPYMRMPSGAGHDAMMMARHMPSAMLFVPSIGGRSHDIVEDTDDADIVLGCRVLAASVERILGGA